MPLQCLRLHRLLSVEECIPLLVVRSGHTGCCEGWKPPDGESLVFPGQLLVSKVDFLVDHFHRLAIQGFGHRHQMIVEYIP